MQTIQVKVGEDKKTIPIGYRGENNARQVKFNIEYFKDNFGSNGSVSLLVLRPGDETVYPISLAIPPSDPDNVSWTVTSEDTATSGEGRIELQWIVGTAVAKSQTWSTIVEKDIGDATDGFPAEPGSWAERLVAVETAIARLDPSLIEDEYERAVGVEGDKNNLRTSTKANLVAAINEVDTHADARVRKVGDTMTGTLFMDNNNLRFNDQEITPGSPPASHHIGPGIFFSDPSWTSGTTADAKFHSFIRPAYYSTEKLGITLSTRRRFGQSLETLVTNSLGLLVGDDQTPYILLDHPEAWRDALGVVPLTRKINNKSLSSDITLTASDVGARASDWMPTAANVGAVPISRTINGKALSTDITLRASDVGAPAYAGGRVVYYGDACSYSSDTHVSLDSGTYGSQYNYNYTIPSGAYLLGAIVRKTATDLEIFGYMIPSGQAGSPPPTTGEISVRARSGSSDVTTRNIGVRPIYTYPSS